MNAFMEELCAICFDNVFLNIFVCLFVFVLLVFVFLQGKVCVCVKKPSLSHHCGVNLPNPDLWLQPQW